MEGQNTPPPATVDTDALMAQLRERVAEKKARGLYRADALVRETMDAGDDGETLERLRANAVLHQSLAVSPSTRPGIGRAVELAKGFAVRASFTNLQGVIEQQSRVNGDLINVLRRLTERVDALTARAESAEGADPAAQDLALTRRAEHLPGAHHLSGRDELAAAPEGAHAALVVGSAVLAGADAQALAGAATDLARAVPEGGTVLLAAGEGDATALAALLLAAGFAAASPEGADGADDRVTIVVARR